MKEINEIKLTFDSRSINEGFSRVALGAFASSLDPTLEEISDIKTAVSEAVTNCIVHAYPEKIGKIYISAAIYEEGIIRIKIKDKGVGIENIPKAMEPLFTTLAGERAGLGFAVMESFTDKVKVTSKLSKGTTITLYKRIGGRNKTKV